MDEDAIKRLLEAQSGDLRRHFDVTAERFERKVELVAEAVTQLDEKVDRRLGEMNQAMLSGFAETQAMIKFSHAELDRRVRLLEEGLSALQVRVEKLESSTH
jgi:hypothetical protein